jgi:hypothetical protein
VSAATVTLGYSTTGGLQAGTTSLPTLGYGLGVTATSNTASAKDTFEAEAFAPDTFASGTWRGTGVAIVYPDPTTFTQLIGLRNAESKLLGLRAGETEVLGLRESETKLLRRP